jgi:hypothetical protein
VGSRAEWPCTATTSRPQGSSCNAHSTATGFKTPPAASRSHGLFMDELFTLHPNGLFLRGEALDCGYRDRDLADARRQGFLARVRHGAYAPGATWAESDPVGRHRLKAQAVLLTHAGRVALSHTSGAAEHGLRLWEQDLDLVHVTRLDSTSGRRQAGVVYHEGDWVPDDIYLKDEMLLLGPEQCALGAASLTSVRGGLPTLDSLFDLALGNPDSLQAAYRRRSRWPHSRKLQITVRLARPGAESLAESLTRHLMWAHHIPEPHLQFKVYDTNGVLVGVTDFAWPEYQLLGEFDGKLKYGRALKAGEQASDVVFQEKVREDLLREITGWAMIRYIWRDLYRGDLFAARTRRMLHRADAA